MKSAGIVKLAVINMLVLIGTVLSLLFLMSVAGDTVNFAKTFFPKKDKRAELPSYQDHDKARRVYNDQRISNSAYVPFNEWRQPKYASENLNINADGYRMHTAGSTNNKDAHSLGFFGGSTVWGTGVDDNGTLPAQFDAITDQFAVTNYGERGYTSLQNLIDLMKLINQNKPPSTAIFFEGFNDIWVHCNEIVSPSLNGHLEERHIQSALNRAEKKNYLFNNIIAPIMSLTLEVIGGQENAQSASCSKNRARAEAVAELIVRNMEMGHALVSSYGGKFYVFLQPNAYVGHPRIDHLELETPDRLIQRAQFDAVYPLVREKIRNKEINWFFDISDAIDGNTYLLVDHAHVTDEGNRIIAEAIKQKIGNF
jgi:lysophospholipase L1-like esterase